MEHNLRVLVLLSTIAATFAFGFNFGATDPPTTKAPITTPAPPPKQFANNGAPLRQFDGTPSRPEVPEPHYTFRYMVQDSRTGDYKSQEERRDGSHVRGTYSVAEPNGDLRVVSYSSDGDSGFRAEVRVEPAGAPTPQEGRTFASFFPDPTAIFKTPTYFRTPIAANNNNNRPNIYDRNLVNRPVPVQQNLQNMMVERPNKVQQNVFTDRPTQVPQNVYDRPTQMPQNFYANRPTQVPENIYSERPTQVPKNVFTDRPTPLSQSFFAERPMQVSQNSFDRPFEPQTEDINQMLMYPVFDRTRIPETQGIPITPASTYPLFNKPIVVEYNKDGNFYSGYRPHLPETPAIPITPPSPLEQQSDIITGTSKPSSIFSPISSLFRRPTVTPRPTAIPPRRYATSTPYPQQPFQFMRFAPAVYAPQPQPQQQPQVQQIWQPSNSPYTNYYTNGGQTPYMLVRTYLVPVPGGRPPTNIMPMPMEPMTQPIMTTPPVKPIPVKTTTSPIQTETNPPIEPVTTAQISETTI